MSEESWRSENVILFAAARKRHAFEVTPSEQVTLRTSLPDISADAAKLSQELLELRARIRSVLA